MSDLARKLCANCDSVIDDLETSKFCTQKCYYAWEYRQDNKEEAPAEAGAPKSDGSAPIPSAQIPAAFSTAENLVLALTGEALITPSGEVSLPILEKALIRGLTTHTRLLVLRDAFKDYAAGLMSPGELINKISSQVKHV